MSNNIQIFLNDFLSRRDLDIPDGRPLYAYKMTKTEYEEIKQLLKDEWDDTRSHFAGFVLFSVEFLRKENNQSHLEWNLIFNSIEREDTNTHHQRSKITKEGLRYWQRQIFEGSATEYLETLRGECGIQNSVLRTEHSIKKLIVDSFEFHQFYSEQKDFIDFIQSRADNLGLPQVLQNDTFYQLIFKLCVKLLELKKSHAIASQENPFSFLTNQEPNWKNEFPINIDEEDFYDTLLSDISKIKEKDPVAIFINHYLDKGDNQDSYSIKSIINTKKGHYDPGSIYLNDTDLEKIPNHFELYLEIENEKEILLNLTKTVADKIAIKDSAIPVKLYGKDWKIGVSSKSTVEEIYTEFPSSFRLSKNEPLVFTKTDEGRYKFKGSGSIRMKESACRILLRVENHRLEEFQNASFVGKTKGGLMIYEICDDVVINDSQENLIYRISLNQERETYKSIELSNQILPEIGFFNLRDFNEVYIGKPVVKYFNKITLQKEHFSGYVEYQTKDKNWRNFRESNEYGRIRLRFIDEGETIAYKKVNILPADLKVLIDSNKKSVVLKTKSPLKCITKRNNENVEIEKFEESFLIEFNEQEKYENAFSEISVGSSSSQLFNLKIPNPLNNIVFLNGDKNIINRAQLSFTDLFGHSIIINNYRDRKETIPFIFKLFDQNNKEVNGITLMKNPTIESKQSLEIPLYKWKSSLKNLFAISQNVHASIKITSPTPHHFIEIKRYDFNLNIQEGIASLNQDLVEDRFIELHAFRLDDIFEPEKIIKLEASFEDQCRWDLNSLQEEGVWFVYPSENSEISISPRAYLNITEQIEKQVKYEVESIHQTSLMSYVDRKESLNDFFDSLSLSFETPVWKELYDLHQETGHLPLSALDVWKAFIESPKAVVTYLLSDYNDDSLMLKITEELNFNWHLVPRDIWQKTFLAWVEYSDSKNYSETIFQAILEQKIKLISAGLGLDNILKIVHGYTSQLNEGDVRNKVNELINSGENGGIKIRRANDRWENDSPKLISEKFRALPRELKSVIPDNIRNHEKPVIYTPFIFAYHTIEGDFLKKEELDTITLMKLKGNQDFDKEYFSKCFTLIQAYSNQLKQ